MLRVMTVVLVVLGLMSAMLLAGRHFLLIRIDEERAAVRAMGYPVNLEELSALRGEPPIGPNAADHYRNLPRLYVSPIPEPGLGMAMRSRGRGSRSLRRRAFNPAFAFHQRPPCQAMSGEAVRASTKYLSDNQDYLDEIRRALTIDVCNFGHELKRGAPEARILLQAARILSLEGRMLVEEGDLFAASECMLEILGVAEHSCRTPVLVSRLTGIGQGNMAFELMRAILCHGSIPTEYVAAISKRLADAESFASPEDMIVSVLCSNQSLFDDPDIASVFGARGRGLTRPRSWNEFLGALRWETYTVSGLVDADGLHSLRFFREMLESVNLPEHEQFKVIDRQHREFFDSMPSWRMAKRLFMPAIGDALNRSYEFRAACRCARTMLAVEQYGSVHGAPPDSLSVLAPEFATTVPVDPFTGDPLKYQILVDGYQVYSVGKDRRDDGGNESRDVVFQVERSKLPISEQSRPTDNRFSRIR